MPRGDDRRDPLIALRIPPPLDARLRAEAADTGTSISEIVRSAIDARLTPDARLRRLTPQQAVKTRGRVPTADGCQHRVRPGSYCKRCERIV